MVFPELLVRGRVRIEDVITEEGRLDPLPTRPKPNDKRCGLRSHDHGYRTHARIGHPTRCWLVHDVCQPALCSPTAEDQESRSGDPSDHSPGLPG